MEPRIGGSGPTALASHLSTLNALVALSDLSHLLNTNPLLALPTVFVGGVLTSLTPCIYPMIPITAAIMGGTTVTPDGGTQSRSGRRALIMTASYTSGLALVYASLGLVAGLTGTLFGGISTNRWALIVMSNVLLVFAMMMLDVIPVSVPTRWLAGAASAGNGHRALGAFVMGATSGLVAAPCGAPVMAALLTWVATTHSAVLGFAYLLAFSLGMTALLAVVGLAAGGAVRLPRPGAWMVTVKRAFAVLMLLTSQYYLIQAGQVWL